jgi:tRNA A37 methylthiotransferase MiaB
MKINEVIPFRKRPFTPQQAMIKNLVKNVENSRKRLQAERDRQRRTREMEKQRKIGEQMTQLKDRNGKLLGILRRFDNKEEIRDMSGKLRGVYFYKNNQTYSSNGSLFGIGNLLSSLLLHS